MSKLVKRAPVGLGALALVCLAWIAFSSVAGGSLLNEAVAGLQTLERQTQQSGRLPQLAEWNRVRQQFETARGADEANPNIAEYQAVLFAMQVQDGENYMSFADEERKALARAAVLRPDSAYPWLRLAMSKYRTGEIDAAFYRALDNAFLLGPREPVVQLAAADMGFALWDEMPAATRTQISREIAEAARFHAAEILETAQRRGRLALACDLGKFGNMVACRSLRGASLQLGN